VTESFGAAEVPWSSSFF